MDSSNPSWELVRRFMRRQCGVVLSADQSYLLDARLGGVVRELRFSSVDAFVQAACASGAAPELVSSLVDAMTIHETYFFRDRNFWNVLAEQILPSVGGSPQSRRRLRIWSAACSTGQEPYSLAILLEEKFPELAERTEILASDVSLRSLERAREGRFSLLDINRGLGASRMLRHLEQSGSQYRLHSRLRQRIQWFQHNLVGASPGPSNCDIVLCRNVLIYFDEVDRESAVRRIRDATALNGYIGVGSTELLRGHAIAPGWYVPASLTSIMSEQRSL